MYIVIEYGMPYICDELRNSSPNRLAVMAQSWSECTAFDLSCEYKMVPSEFKEYGLFTKVLAHTVYNPQENIEYRWQKSGDYSINRIVDLVEKGLQSDDDIIQQHLDGEVIIKLLNSAKSFEEMVMSVRAICGEYEEDKNVRVYVEKIIGKSL